MVTHILSMCCNGGELFSSSLSTSEILIQATKKKKKVPTFCLGFMTLYPELRSNILFAVAFFVTRILFHIILGVSYFLHDNRAQATGGSYIPFFLLASIFPLHALWFYGCIKGFLRRAAKQYTPVSTTVPLRIVPEDRPAKVAPQREPQSKRAATPIRPRVTDNRYQTRSTDSTPSQALPTYDLKLERSKLHSRRIYSRSMSLSSNDSRSSVTGTIRTKLYASLPNTEVAFDYVGLGRGSAQEQ